MRERFSLTAQMRDHDPLTAAVAYAEAGLKVLATWGIDADGNCECGQRGCKKGKHPITEFFPRGFHSGTTDRATLRKVWKKHPNANVAIVPDNELFVVDIDGQAGQAAIDALNFPKTVAAKTARGVHLYFTTLSRRRLQSFPEVDCRHDGNGYVLAPPSRHPTGVRYRWLNGASRSALVVIPRGASVGLKRKLNVSLGGLREPTKAWRSVYLRYRKMLHPRVKFLIDYKQAAGFEGDRSKCIYEIVADLHRVKASADEIETILWHNPYFLAKHGKDLPALHTELGRILSKLGDAQ
jgi:hypothetical protein